jgi:hypothetical protein
MGFEEQIAIEIKAIEAAIFYLEQKPDCKTAVFELKKALMLFSLRAELNAGEICLH